MAKYNKKTVDKIVGLWKSDTYTIAEVCQRVGISTKTYFQWINVHEEFAEAIEKAEDERMNMFVAEAKKSLLKKIQGYTADEVKVVTVPSGRKDANGNPKPQIKEQTTTKKHIAPDTAAVIFTLTNGEPSRWRNRQTNELTGKDGKDLIQQLTDDELDERIRVLQRKCE